MLSSVVCDYGAARALYIVCYLMSRCIFHWGVLPILKLSARSCRKVRSFTEAIDVLMTSLHL